MEFVEPPPEARGERTKRWGEIVDTLMDNPGKWALVGNFSPGIATAIRRGRYKVFLRDFEGTDFEEQAYMKRYWEVTTRKTHDGRRNDVYVRWLG